MKADAEAEALKSVKSKIKNQGTQAQRMAELDEASAKRYYVVNKLA